MLSFNLENFEFLKTQTLDLSKFILGPTDFKISRVTCIVYFIYEAVTDLFKCPRCCGSVKFQFLLALFPLCFLLLGSGLHLESSMLKTPQSKLSVHIVSHTQNTESECKYYPLCKETKNKWR